MQKAGFYILVRKPYTVSLPPSFNSYCALFALILSYFSFMFPFTFALFLSPSPFFLYLLHFLSFDHFFSSPNPLFTFLSRMTLADIFSPPPPQGGRGIPVISNIDPCAKGRKIRRKDYVRSKDWRTSRQENIIFEGEGIGFFFEGGEEGEYRFQTDMQTHEEATNCRLSRNNQDFIKGPRIPKNSRRRAT